MPTPNLKKIHKYPLTRDYAAAVLGKRRTQQQRRENTRTLVLEEACRLFGENGYAGTSLRDIASACNLTIRPVYHYFGNKKELFLAVTEKMESKLAAKIETEIASHGGVPIRSGWEAFTEVARDQRFRQIVLIDAPAILGRGRWPESPVVKVVHRAFQERLPHLEPRQSELIIRMAIAALAEMAMILGENPGELDSATAVIDTMTKLLE